MDKNVSATMKLGVVLLVMLVLVAGVLFVLMNIAKLREAFMIGG